MFKKFKQFFTRLFTRLIRQPSAQEEPKEWRPKPLTPEELKGIRKEVEALAEERAKADAEDLPAMLEVLAQLEEEPEEDE